MIYYVYNRGDYVRRYWFLFSFLSSFIFKENHIVEENKPSEKNVTEELNGIDIDGIGNLLKGFTKNIIRPSPMLES